MDYKELIDKYWQGTTSPEEEATLRQQLTEIPGSLDPETEQLLRQLNQFSQLSLGKEFGESFMQRMAEEPPKRVSLWRRLPSIAAAVILIAGIGTVFTVYLQPDPPPVIAAEQDPEKAYQLATEALLLMSSKLNEATEYTAELDRFNTATKKIQKEKIQNQN